MARSASLTAALAIALLAVSGARGAETQAPKPGGTLVMGTLREPPCLNAFFVRCHTGTPPAELIMGVALRGAFKVGPGFTWQYDLVSDVDFTTTRPFTLTYRIRPEARWSDGIAITARDFEFTYQTLLELPKEDRSVLGLEFVRSVRPVNAKTVKVVLRSRYGGWRNLFAHVLPRHALRGEDFSTVWLSGIQNPKTGRPIGSGPFLIGGWQRGRGVTFVRNPRYWGAHRSYLDRIVLRFCQSCSDPVAEQIELLRGRELDLVGFLGPSAEQVREFRRLHGVAVLASPGPLWEHIDIRTKHPGHPALEKKEVRRALVYALDRAAIARVYGARGDAVPTASAVFLTGNPDYRPNWQIYRHRPAHARRLLEQAGCHRGADNIYICAGEPMSLRFATTTGVRPHAFQLIQSQLLQVGIAVEPVYTTIQTIVGQLMARGDFDLALFNWIMSPGYEVDTSDRYGCGGGENYAGYCQRLVTKDLDQARRILDTARLARVLNRADEQIARDVPVIPIAERPVLAAFDSSVRGVSLKTHAWNPFAGAEDWWLDD